ncbi:MAG: ATPase, T2SS/T4P/T4SS family [Candidatus Omnitrophota bacterium]|nr:Flp pilus assembly complex ATPase component TadA [Candidatus Omnitrophota bacterium]MBU1929577.1 Flp pilus assembly complex ATPase component TadA [Candidatus Omnitrophota bacterium]MBU2034983.1 Flp pilus assembly complex ATPase component TadA [Candidatus Omnitrophota bacterium]MBU2258602.1 Flp pilus assembly complex ATPase component TadA [Candidatus Omnitrophota bacterium]
MYKERYLRLGEILIKEKLITESQLEKAIMLQKQEGGRLGEILVRIGMVKEEQLVTVLGKQLGIPYFSLGTGMLRPASDQSLEKLVANDFAMKNLVLPLSRTMNSLTVAMIDPLDLILIDNLKKLTGCEINPVITTRADIIKAVEEFYGKSAMLKDAVDASYDVESITPVPADYADEELSLDKLIAKAEEAPVIKLVDLIIRQAIHERASDIHIEPFKDRMSLRYRIDGKLHEVSPPANHLILPIISRIKILAKLDIAEKRLPQDGAFLVKMENNVVDLRISTVPTIYGEKIVLRILNRGQVILDLNQLGFEASQLEIIRKMITAPYGLVFVTGPTGSGKTTTLYSILNEIKNPTKNIITIEDPVEYKLDGINQVQIKPDIGLTFSSALRSFLRQDPDIMLVGEVRDLETAEICVRSALTGHLVLSTLHTNNAASAINRLTDIGVESYLITPSLLCVVAQRLIRKLCSFCKEAYEPASAQLGNLKIKADLIYRAKGCPKCNNIGYSGRTCISEVMRVDTDIRMMIAEKSSYQRIEEAARKAGMVSLRDIAVKKVEDGITSIEEALSATLEL